MHRGSYDVWSAGVARKALLPGTRTGNPTAAAKALLGARTVRRAKAVLKRKGRKRAHRGNPLPAVASLLGGSLVKKLFGGPDPEKQKQRVAHIQALRDVVAGTMKPWSGMTQTIALANLRGIAQGRELLGVAINPVTVAAAQAALTSLGKDSGGAVVPAQTPVGALSQLLGTPAGGQLVTGVVRAATSRGRSRRQRYPTYTDRYGRQRYSTRPPGGAPMRLPAGATMSAGTPYNFFTGAVGKGGVGATVGQLAIAGAAGVGAYLVTQRLLQYLGGRAQSQEEAGVNAAKALHQALEDYKQQHGAYPPPAERQAMKAAYAAKLEELGYDPVTFARKRGAVSEFLETYNPFGG